MDAYGWAFLWIVVLVVAAAVLIAGVAIWIGGLLAQVAGAFSVIP